MVVERASRTVVDESVPPRGLPGAVAVDAQVATENFPVALRLLPRPVRSDLLAVYGFARFADDIGDSYAGDRLHALDWLEGELDAAAHGRARHPLLVRLAPTIERHDLDLQPFRDLIEANRRDQRIHRYETFADLLDYCRLSAEPVGRLVLAVFGVADPAAERLSDRICSGLQVVEHLQDVGEDAARGRIYLPRQDLRSYGCEETELNQPTASPALRRLVAHECDRARQLLEAGRPLLRRLPLPAKVAVTGFVAGGRAALDAVAAADHDVLGRECRPTRRAIARHGVALLAGAAVRRRAAAWT